MLPIKARPSFSPSLSSSLVSCTRGKQRKPAFKEHTMEFVRMNTLTLAQTLQMLDSHAASPILLSSVHRRVRCSSLRCFSFRQPECLHCQRVHHVRVSVGDHSPALWETSTNKARQAPPGITELPCFRTDLILRSLPLAVASRSRPHYLRVPIGHHRSFERLGCVLLGEPVSLRKRDEHRSCSYQNISDPSDCSHQLLRRSYLLLSQAMSQGWGNER